MIKLKQEIEKGMKAEFQIRDDGMTVKGQRMCVPEYGELKRDIMEEAHSSAYAMHQGSTKMYKTLKEHYWWNGMKKEILGFISRCLTCQQVKAEHQRPRGEDTVTSYSSMEMGEDHYGFCDRSSTNSEAARCYMGDS